MKLFDSNKAICFDFDFPFSIKNIVFIIHHLPIGQKSHRIILQDKDIQ